MVPSSAFHVTGKGIEAQRGEGICVMKNGLSRSQTQAMGFWNHLGGGQEDRTDFILTEGGRERPLSSADGIIRASAL